ncbi:MAG: tetratricopeptide (TPR) repeat protein [Arcticibacterium sp.]|jgi:tetratricopeptide (TPR) repeat protein
MKRAIYIILIIELFGGVAKAQNLDQTFHFANNLFEQDDYKNALEVYRRTLFFDQNNEFGPRVFKNMADCLYETSQYQEAAYYYDLAYFVHSGYLQADISLKKASCHLLLREYNQTKIELFNLPDSLSPEQKELSVFYDAMLNFAQGNFEASKGLFLQIAPDSTVINALFDKNKKIDKLKPKTAKILSIIMPGLGQFYAGDIKNGLNSLILSGGLFYLGVRSAVRTSLLDAGLSVIPWFQRYYSGGYNKAYAIAEAKVKERRHKVFNELLEQVED